MSPNPWGYERCCCSGSASTPNALGQRSPCRGSTRARRSATSLTWTLRGGQHIAPQQEVTDPGSLFQAALPGSRASGRLQGCGPSCRLFLLPPPRTRAPGTPPPGARSCAVRRTVVSAVETNVRPLSPRDPLPISAPPAPRPLTAGTHGSLWTPTSTASPHGRLDRRAQAKWRDHPSPGEGASAPWEGADTMPTYMDMHDIPGVKAADFVGAHEADCACRASTASTTSTTGSTRRQARCSASSTPPTRRPRTASIARPTGSWHTPSTRWSRERRGQPPSGASSRSRSCPPRRITVTQTVAAGGKGLRARPGSGMEYCQAWPLSSQS